MLITQELIEKAKKIANENYDSWGQYVVECYTDKELSADLSDFSTLEEWIDIRISVANVLEERSSWRD